LPFQEIEVADLGFGGFVAVAENQPEAGFLRRLFDPFATSVK
jgi:hypothetical protein